MIRLKRFFKILIVLFVIAIKCDGQNLYDLSHSKQYAEFLSESQQYKLAAMEFERLVFMDPSNINFRQNLILTYRKSGQFDQGINRIERWYPSVIADTTIFREYIKLNYLNYNFSNGLNHLGQSSLLPFGEKVYYEMSGLMLQKQWIDAKKFAEANADLQLYGFTDLCRLLQQQETIKYKKPGMALALSAVVPGLGKIYSTDWKDGLISLLFVATNAFQAYRGFSKDGISSVYGWIFGGLSIGFYSGNLYGSWKSARDYNLRSEEALYHEIQHNIFDRF